MAIAQSGYRPQVNVGASIGVQYLQTRSGSTTADAAGAASTGATSASTGTSLGGVSTGSTGIGTSTGTGVSTEELGRSGAFAVGADLSTGMLRAGRRARPEVALVAGDALRLPFADGTFAAVTISFAQRNVVDVDGALRELGRVTRPGGRLVVCEFSHPTNGPFRTVYMQYLMRSLPVVARKVSSNPDAYVYLAESIRAWPDQRALAARIAGAGTWSRVGWRNLTGGIVALHRATKA